MRELKVFIAEDNPGDVMVIELALREEGIQYHLTPARDGEDAVQLIKRMGKPNEPACPDVMLLDLNLPKVTGVEVLAEFRKHPECRETPVVVVTSTALPSEMADIQQLGPVHYFQKTVHLDEFLKLGKYVAEVASIQNS